MASLLKASRLRSFTRRFERKARAGWIASGVLVKIHGVVSRLVALAGGKAAVKCGIGVAVAMIAVRSLAVLRGGKAAIKFGIGVTAAEAAVRPVAALTRDKAVIKVGIGVSVAVPAVRPVAVLNGDKAAVKFGIGVAAAVAAIMPVARKVSEGGREVIGLEMPKRKRIEQKCMRRDLDGKFCIWKLQ